MGPRARHSLASASLIVQRKVLSQRVGLERRLAFAVDPAHAGALASRSRRYIDLNRCANVRETVSFSGRDFNVITG